METNHHIQNNSLKGVSFTSGDIFVPDNVG